MDTKLHCFKPQVVPNNDLKAIAKNLSLLKLTQLSLFAKLGRLLNKRFPADDVTTFAYIKSADNL